MILTETIAGAVDFDGQPGSGRISFVEYNTIPHSSRIHIHGIYYRQPTGDVVAVYGFFKAVTDSQEGLAFSADGTTLRLPGTVEGAHLRACGGVVPRQADGRHYFLEVYTTGKTETADLFVDFEIRPHATRVDDESGSP